MSAHLPIRELASLALPTDMREGLFAMIQIKAAFDDAGTHADSEVVVIGALIGSVQQWEIFERAWAAKLAAPLPGKPALNKFHLADCNAGKGEFFGYSDAEQDAVTHDFRKIVIDAKLTSIASATDKKAWDELVIGPYRKTLGPALSICLENSIAETIRIATGPATPPQTEIAVIIDKGILTPAIQQVAEAFTCHLGNPRILSVNFLPVQRSLPLQGADIVATESYWHAIQVLRNGLGAQPRAHMRHYLNNMLAEGLIVRREEIVEMLRTNFDSEGRRLGGQSS